MSAAPVPVDPFDAALHLAAAITRAATDAKHLKPWKGAAVESRRVMLALAASYFQSDDIAAQLADHCFENQIDEEGYRVDEFGWRIGSAAA